MDNYGYKMIPGNEYTITREIKIHTKPLRRVQVQQTGIFYRETD